MSGRHQEGLRKCLEDVWRVDGGCLEGVWNKNPGVWKVSESCLKDVCRVSGNQTLLEGLAM